jgi:hypothetical protein
MSAAIHYNDRNGTADNQASTFDFNERTPTLSLVKTELAGDKIISERDGCKFCLGCVICSENLERESDV